MKQFFTLLLCGMSALAFSQSHTQGALNINLGYEIGIANSLTFEINDESGDFDGDVSQGSFRFDFQYGIADNLSAGLAARVGSLTTSFEGSTSESTTNYTNVGVEARYFFVNNDSFNVFAAPEVGLNMFNADDDEEDNSNGLFWGVHAGGNYMFSELIGLNARIGYGAKGASDEAELLGQTIKTSSTVSGLNFGIGLTLAFQ